VIPCAIQEQPSASASTTPVQGLSLKPVAAAPGVSYPGPPPVRGYTVQFSAASTPQAPVQVDARAATTPAPVTPPVPQSQPVMPQRGPQQAYLPQQFATQPWAGTQPVMGQPVMGQPSMGQPSMSGFAFLPGGSLQGASLNLFNQMPTQAYARPTVVPGQTPSYIAPATQGYQQLPSYVLPPQPQMLQGISPPLGLAIPAGAVQGRPASSNLGWMQAPQIAT